MLNTRGQGLSLTVIIVAALSLIVLVVLIMIFTGRIAVFSEGVNKAGQTELVQMRIQYGDCRPSGAAEAKFGAAVGTAESEAAKEIARGEFQDVISACKQSSDKDSCGAADGCIWEAKP